jgi:hypothetical protein
VTVTLFARAWIGSPLFSDSFLNQITGLLGRWFRGNQIDSPRSGQEHKCASIDPLGLKISWFFKDFEKVPPLARFPRVPPQA